MLNLVETKSILINNDFIVLQIQFLQFFVLLDSLGNCVEGCMCPLKGLVLVHCTMPCFPPPPLPTPILRLVYKGLMFCKDKQY